MISYLYVKTHKKTGLKYLGKTMYDPFTYKGSGVYWLTHFKEYGEEHDTKIIQECQTKEELREWGIYYSNLWQVVKSSEWANKKVEVGDGGSAPDMLWWNNGIDKQRATECPGPGWQPGRLLEGRRWWTDGTHRAISVDCPGPNWYPGGTETWSTKGLCWWTNGTENRVQLESPGPDWIRGQSKNTNRGLRTWNNGTEQKMSDECPGPEWRLGMINASGARWWTNGVADHRSKEPPGPEWKLGRINVRKTYSKKSVV